MLSGCLPDNQVYMLKGEQKAFKALGWDVPTAAQNSGAARSFQAFVKQVRDQEWVRAKAFLVNKGRLKAILKQHPCLKKGRFAVWDDNPKMQTRRTRLRVACRGDKFMVRAVFQDELGWRFLFVKLAASNKKRGI